MSDCLRVGLAMGISGDDPFAFASLARGLCCRDTVVNYPLHETPETMRVWKQIFDDVGLRVASWAIPYYSDDVLANADARQQFEDLTVRAFDNLAHLGADTAHTFVMLRAGEGEEERAQRWVQLIDTARCVCAQAGQRSIRVAHHFGWTPDLLVWNTTTALRFLDAVGARNCGVLFCPGSFFSAGDDVLEATRALASRSYLVHLRDARGISPACEPLHLGQGRLPFRQLLAELLRWNYRGVVFAEHLAPVPGEAREELAQAMAFGYLRGLLEGLEA